MVLNQEIIIVNSHKCSSYSHNSGGNCNSIHAPINYSYICWSWVIMQHYSLKLEMLLQNVTLWPIIHILEFWEKSEIQCVYFVLNRGKTAIKVGQFPKFRLLIIKFQVSKSVSLRKDLYTANDNGKLSTKMLKFMD